jgi:hypothetical protein
LSSQSAAATESQEVERPPDVAADFRNKLVRLMTDNASRNGELAAEILFIFKRSGFFFGLFLLG